MLTLTNNILFANGEPLIRFDTLAEAIGYLMECGYQPDPMAWLCGKERGTWTFSKRPYAS